MANKIINNYLALLQGEDLSTATLKAVEADLSNFWRWWEQAHHRPFSPEYLVSRDLRHWKIHRQEVEGISPKTINRNLSSLRGFCIWAVEQGLMVEDPAAGIADVPIDPLAPQSLPDEAIDALLRATQSITDPRLRARDQALLALLVYGGLRTQEACNLQLRDLDLAGGNLTIRRGKREKVRRIPLHTDAQERLQQYLDTVRCPEGLPPMGSQAEREPLLVGVQVTVTGQPLRPGIQTRIVRKRVKQLGQTAAAALQQLAKREAKVQQTARLNALAQQLEQISPHQLRHSLARRLLQRGTPLPEIQRILGHSRLSTTGMYLIPSEADLRAAIERTGV